MQISRLLSVIGVAFLMTANASTAAAQTVKKCRAADANSANLITELTLMVTSTDSETVADRTNIYHVPVVSASQIALVTDGRYVRRLCWP
jgi:hypothetical protein